MVLCFTAELLLKIYMKIYGIIIESIDKEPL